MWLDFKLSCRSIALAKFIVSQVYRIISHNMSYHPMLLCIFIFLLHYCDQLFFLAGHVSPMDPGQLEMGSGFSCYGSSSGLVGAYYAVFLCKEVFYGSIFLPDCSHTAHPYSQTHCICDICPITGAAYGDKHCEATTRVCHIDCLFMFYYAKCVQFTAGCHRSVTGHALVYDYLCASICSSFHARGSGEFRNYVCLFMFYHAKLCSIHSRQL